MKIPKTIKVGGFIWTIQEDEKIATEGSVYGSTHHGKQQIFIDPDISQQKKEQTLLHEIMHTVFWQSGLNFRYRENKDFEEDVVTSLSMGLYQVLKDNNFLK